MAEPTSELVQIVIKLAPNVVSELDELQRAFGATSRAEIVRKALGLLRLAQRAREQGGDIAIVLADGVPQKVLVA
jgi:metal-responsive CopG/Arc/MetJ family transcriptional regulator